MRNLKLLVKIQTLFGVTKAEIIFVLFILSGLIIGTVVKYFSEPGTGKSSQSKDMYRLLDSLAEVQKSAYTGSNINGNSDSVLARGDTIIQKDKSFPSYKKKEITKVSLDINIASKAELMKLPGVGEKTAESIINYRSTRKFKKPEDIMKIKGIGRKKFEKMKDLIHTN